MAHFLVDASLPRAVALAIRSNGHLATDVRDIGLTSAPDHLIAAHAKAYAMCLITADGDFGDVREYPPNDYAGIVVIYPPPDANRKTVVEMIERFLMDANVLAQLAGRLVIVESWRIRC